MNKIKLFSIQCSLKKKLYMYLKIITSIAHFARKCSCNIKMHELLLLFIEIVSTLFLEYKYNYEKANLNIALHF